MSVKKFQSDLGEVAVTKSQIERNRTECQDWDRIEKTFSDRKLVDFAHYSDIEELEYEDGSIYPNIRMKVDGEWKRMFFHIGDEAKQCYKELKYRINAYKQVFE